MEPALEPETAVGKAVKVNIFEKECLTVILIPKRMALYSSILTYKILFRYGRTLILLVEMGDHEY